MLIVYDEKMKTKSVYCARVRGHVIVPTHLLKMQFNMLKKFSKLIVNLSKLQQ